MGMRPPHIRDENGDASGILVWEEAPVLWGSPSPQSSPRGRGSASLPPFWIPVRYRGSGCAFDGKTKWGRCVDVGGGIAVDVLSRDVSAWIPAPYRGYGAGSSRE